jgi:hypothetical protein
MATANTTKWIGIGLLGPPLYVALMQPSIKARQVGFSAPRRRHILCMGLWGRDGPR